MLAGQIAALVGGVLITFAFGWLVSLCGMYETVETPTGPSSKPGWIVVWPILAVGLLQLIGTGFVLSR